MRKHANGYYARYRLSGKEFESYFDELWQEFGKYSAIERDTGDEARLIYPGEFESDFGALGWECPAETVVYEGPREGDGGGATYYVDLNSDLVFQRTGFW